MESVFEGGELEWRTWAAKSVTNDSKRCIRCCRKSRDPGFADRDFLLLSLVSRGGYTAERTKAL